MRSREDIKTFAKRVRQWWLEESKHEFRVDDFRDALRESLLIRQAAFLNKRVSHLDNEDFLNLIEALKDGEEEERDSTVRTRKGRVVKGPAVEKVNRES